jgi:hypothetical protein
MANGTRTALLLTAACTLLLAPAGSASSAVKGKRREFRSPGGVAEACVALDRMPGGVYSEADTRQEDVLCSVDFYARAHAVCPKLFSTSPGTLVYDISAGPYANNPAGFERDVCPKGRPVEREAMGEPISFKMSVNSAKTSATFSNSSLIYYHFSRYFDASIHVPVSVLRSMDRNEHLQRVTSPGGALSAHRSGLGMNHAAWTVLQRAEQDPRSYPVADELFTPTRDQVYGVLLHPKGARYNQDVNGSRRSGYGEGQSRDFQETVPFRALRSPNPLPEAVDTALARAGQGRQARPGAGASRVQVAFWMRDLIDITLLDYIFSQQDRVGNIDYLLLWHWVENNEVKRAPAHGKAVPSEIARFNPVLLQRTELGDNDAGVRTSYANFTRRTRMLENLRHYSSSTYRRLLALERDFAAKGPVREYVRTTFGLSDKEFGQVERNTLAAAAILRTACRQGLLRFDVEPEEFFRAGTATEKKVDCDNPR